MYVGLPIGAHWALPSPANELAAVAGVARRSTRHLTILQSADNRVSPFHSGSGCSCCRTLGKGRSVLCRPGLIRSSSQSANPHGSAHDLFDTKGKCFSLRHSDRVVCISNQIASMARGGGASLESIRVVANPVDTEFF